MTTVNQLAVLLENQKGALAAVTRILGEAGYNILALSIAEIDTFGVCRLILPESENAAALLRQRGYTVREQPVLVAESEAVQSLLPEATGRVHPDPD